MNSILSAFNEVASLTAAFHGAVVGAKVGVVGSSMLLMAAGLGSATGIVPLAVCLTIAVATTATGGALAYKGAKLLLDPTRREGFIDRAASFGRAVSPTRRMHWHRAGL